ncbi:pyrroloquinoline quinone biosynthesis peptide chaperone PqqD [Pleurocapsa sp. CCALA 161]|uniref:pyrroloquinoline quinone biosynthesis peptide chaperone PqqD n=1 Tax=Pleurocapsa sp. CCALA 161 TaxID=2107688 RepID=UPI000D0560EF|nr:pyrroloquinoline quinone biosynthesis peptide chaperone PqqD [Pleurocapsa sp. CCALA 161]PSB10569.1 pyrroloquinoline quinone biosynthesis peptide chaperone PqqD [Pleurocapsa sp. CCALA 161]
MIEEERVYYLDNLGFASGVRLHWSTARQQHWLLFPEGALFLNPTAVAILSICDGYRSFTAISQILSSQFCDVDINQVQNLLLQMLKRGLLINKTP